MHSQYSVSPQGRTMQYNRGDWPTPVGLNPRFDGAFLNFNHAYKQAGCQSLNPRFDGAFLNWQQGQNAGDKLMS